MACIAVILSLTGNVLVVMKKWQGPAIWIIANFMWIHIDMQAGLYEQAFLFVVFTFIATYGLIAWRRKP